MKDPDLRPLHRRLPAVAAILRCFTLTGCVGMWGDRHHHESSSVVQFLYPNKAQPFIQPQIPTLRLPLRVGVAFIPPGTPQNPYGIYSGQANFTEQQKTDLMRKVATQFKALPFVQSIEIIPTTCLRPGGGFENLDQLRAMLGIDVVVLIAYDQAQNSRDTEASVAYWTIVGGTSSRPSATRPTRSWRQWSTTSPAGACFSARRGTSAIKHGATLFRADYELQQDSARGLEEASAQMTTNLAQEIELFKVRAREQPDTIHIEHKPG